MKNSAPELFKLPLHFTATDCELVCAELDTLIEAGAHAETLREGTEWRIFKAHEEIHKVKEMCDRALSSISGLGFHMRLRDCLAIKNLPHPSPENEHFGWHLDSLRDEFKIFIYLTSVSEKSGPTQLIEKSSSVNFKIRSTWSGAYLGIRDALSSNSRRYMKLSSEFIQKTLKSMNSVTLLAHRGEVFFVNTSAIHRAKPCVSEARYALTLYLEEP